LCRQGYDVYRDLLNTPAFLEMLPGVEGMAGLDLGCGEGHNTRLLAGRGARMFAIDVAPTFVRYARDEERSHPRESVMPPPARRVCPSATPHSISRRRS
jgi:2-polyprenyl-3-methyl-5-hydroxy-6-metoxy-1,4-benzoquinol methylase